MLLNIRDVMTISPPEEERVDMPWSTELSTLSEVLGTKIEWRQTRIEQGRDIGSGGDFGVLI